MNPKLEDVLLKAYGPCLAFVGACSEMRWDTARGHVPRGFCGAAGELVEVKLVLVCAEPGDPHSDEHYGGGNSQSQLQRAYLHAYKSYREGTDLFHRNIRLILGLCWPDCTFDQQLRKTWLVDSVLCSARTEGGRVSGTVESECRRRYLERQPRADADGRRCCSGGQGFQAPGRHAWGHQGPFCGTPGLQLPGSEAVLGRDRKTGAKRRRMLSCSRAYLARVSGAPRFRLSIFAVMIAGSFSYPSDASESTRAATSSGDQ